MKKKLVSTLLALTMCVTLAVSAFAEEIGEPTVPEETENLRTEDSHEHECETEHAVFSWGPSDLLWETSETEGESGSVVRWGISEADVGISVMGANPDGTCTVCGKNNWERVEQEPSPWQSENSSNHKATVLVAYVCLTPGCISGYYDQYTIREPHSLQKTFTGNHYHVEGSVKHMAEYRYTCSACGYTTTKWEYYICPGGNGGSCLYPSSLDGEELMSVTEPEETALPEETTPLEIVVPEESGEDTASDMDFYQQVMELVDELDIELNSDIIDAENSDQHICLVEYDEDKDHVGLAHKKINGDTEQHQVYEEYMGHCTVCKKMVIVSKLIDEDRVSAYAYCLDNTENIDLSSLEANQHSHIWAYSENDFCGYLYDDKEDDTQHDVYKKYNSHCIGCGETTVQSFLYGTENHTWRKVGSLNNCSGDTHQVEYTYVCKCGATRTERESLMQKTFTGNHYHLEGSVKHMAEYKYTCSACGYSTTKWESYICPDGNGGSCLYPSSLDGEELMSVTEPEEPLAPEGTEVLICEESHEHKEDVIFPWGPSDPHWEIAKTEAMEENTVRTVYCYHTDFNLTGLNQESMLTDTPLPGKCPRCGKYNWDSPAYSDWDYLYKDALKHTKIRYIKYYCQTPECFLNGENVLFAETQDYYHAYDQKGDLVSANSANNSSHEAVYSYSCICGDTTTKTETESHSLQRGSFTGNHYHLEGSVKHMAEYKYTCSACGYSTTKWESYICPGGNGGSCLYPSSLDGEELMSVTGPEEVIEPTETDISEEVVTPEEATEPEEQYE